jgi:hypothetical protein
MTAILLGCIHFPTAILAAAADHPWVITDSVQFNPIRDRRQFQILPFDLFNQFIFPHRFTPKAFAHFRPEPLTPIYLYCTTAQKFKQSFPLRKMTKEFLIPFFFFATI